MISKEHYQEIATKYGGYASWAIWADAGATPKSNIGDVSMFDIERNSAILNVLNPNIVLVGLNISRPLYTKLFVNFHDSYFRGNDFKIRHASQNTILWGAYMTDVIKDFANVTAGHVMKYLKANPVFCEENLASFEKEISDLWCENPKIFAFGGDAYKLLVKRFGSKYDITKLRHYSDYRLGPEEYREEVIQLINK